MARPLLVGSSMKSIKLLLPVFLAGACTTSNDTIDPVPLASWQGVRTIAEVTASATENHPVPSADLVMFYVGDACVRTTDDFAATYDGVAMNVVDRGGVVVDDVGCGIPIFSVPIEPITVPSEHVFFVSDASASWRIDISYDSEYHPTIMECDDPAGCDASVNGFSNL
jgi:hypothetical protein